MRSFTSASFVYVTYSRLKDFVYISYLTPMILSSVLASSVFQNFSRPTTEIFQRISIQQLSSNFIEKRLQRKCFPMNCAKFFKKTYILKHLRMATAVYCQTNTTWRKVCLYAIYYSFNSIISEVQKQKITFDLFTNSK